MSASEAACAPDRRYRRKHQGVGLDDAGAGGSRGLDPMARLVSYGIAAVEPGMFGLGPIPAVRQALDRAGWRLSDIATVCGGAS